MNALPNPFTFQSDASLPARFDAPTLAGAESPSVPAIFFMGEDYNSCGNAEGRVAAIGLPVANEHREAKACSGALARSLDRYGVNPKGGAVAPDTRQPAVGIKPNPHEYILEPFSEYASRRCKDKISPPLPERNVDELVNFDALYAAISASHPRDLDLDPPPLFLRKPSKSFMQALFDLAGSRS